MKDLQVTFYDVISILLPASLVLSILHFQTELFHSALLSRIVNNSLAVTSTGGSVTSSVALPTIAGFAVPFIVAYLFGHAINLTTRYIQDTPGWKRILIPRSYTAVSSDDKIVFNRGSFPIAFDKVVGQRILDKLHEFYSITFSPQDNLSDYLIATLPQSAANKRDIFIAIACMMRNTAVVALGFAVFFVYDLIDMFLGQVNVGFVQNDVLFLLATLVSFFLFRSGFLKYERYAEQLLFTAFLTVPKPTGLPVVITKETNSEPQHTTQSTTVSVAPTSNGVSTSL